MATGGKAVLFICVLLALFLLTGAFLWGIGHCFQRDEVRLYCILSYKDSPIKCFCVHAQEVILHISHESGNSRVEPYMCSVVLPPIVSH